MVRMFYAATFVMIASSALGQQCLPTRNVDMHLIYAQLEKECVGAQAGKCVADIQDVSTKHAQLKITPCLPELEKTRGELAGSVGLGLYKIQTTYPEVWAARLKHIDRVSYEGINQLSKR